MLYGRGNNVSMGIAKIKETLPRTPEIEHILNFVENVATRGIIG